jgi:hypothetical protein
MEAISLFLPKQTLHIGHVVTGNSILKAAVALVGCSYLYAYLYLPEFFSLI